MKKKLTHRDMPEGYYGYIYCITNKINGKNYFGQHKLNDVSELFEKYMGSGTRIIKAIKKFGVENFEKTIIEFCETVVVMNQREVEIIKEQKKIGKAEYNMVLWETSYSSCEVCTAKTSNFASLMKHMNEDHNIYESETCEICNKVFKTSNGYRNHKRMVHSETLGYKTKKCKKCDYTTTLNAGLKIHELSAHAERKECPICHIGFVQGKRYENHIIICERNNVHCEDCGLKIWKKSKKCVECERKARLINPLINEKIYISKEDLTALLIRNNGIFTSAAKEIDLSDNCLRKKCRFYNLPTNSAYWRKLAATR